jgi:subtilisin family serine protease
VQNENEPSFAKDRVLAEPDFIYKINTIPNDPRFSEQYFVNKTGGTPVDGDSHGSHVAGIIGAKGNNGLGVAGVKCQLGRLQLLGT